MRWWVLFFFFSSRRRHTRFKCDWSSDVCSSDLLDGAELVDVNPLFEEIARKEGFYSEELIKQVAKTGGLHNIDGIPEKIKRVFVTAHDISPEWHLKMQAVFQNNIDNGV